MSTETAEDRAITVDENTNDEQSASNYDEAIIDQLNSATIDEDVPAENSCPVVEGTSKKTDCEEKITEKKDCLIDGIPIPECLKGDDWAFALEKLRKADFVNIALMKGSYAPPIN